MRSSLQLQPNRRASICYSGLSSQLTGDNGFVSRISSKFVYEELNFRPNASTFITQYTSKQPLRPFSFLLSFSHHILAFFNSSEWRNFYVRRHSDKLFVF